MSGIAAPSSRKNSNGILSGAREKIENHRVAGVLKYDHHSISEAWLPLQRSHSDLLRLKCSLQRAFALVSVGLPDRSAIVPTHTSP
jgi:hypothetical protein